MRKLLILLAFLIINPFTSCDSSKVVPYEKIENKSIIRKVMPYKKRNMGIEEINKSYDKKRQKWIKKNHK